jgi:hypothetical protein
MVAGSRVVLPAPRPLTYRGPPMKAVNNVVICSLDLDGAYASLQNLIMRGAVAPRAPVRLHNDCGRVLLVSPRGNLDPCVLLSGQRTNTAESLAHISAQLGADVTPLVNVAWATHERDGCVMIELIHYMEHGSGHPDANNDKALKRAGRRELRWTVSLAPNLVLVLTVYKHINPVINARGGDQQSGRPLWTSVPLMLFWGCG